MGITRGVASGGCLAAGSGAGGVDGSAEGEPVSSDAEAAEGEGKSPVAAARARVASPVISRHTVAMQHPRKHPKAGKAKSM